MVSRCEIGTLTHKDHNRQVALRIFANKTGCRLWYLWTSVPISCLLCVFHSVTIDFIYSSMIVMLSAG